MGKLIFWGGPEKADFKRWILMLLIGIVSIWVWGIERVLLKLGTMNPATNMPLIKSVLGPFTLLDLFLIGLIWGGLILLARKW